MNQPITRFTAMLNDSVREGPNSAWLAQNSHVTRRAYADMLAERRDAQTTPSENPS